MPFTMLVMKEGVTTVLNIILLCNDVVMICNALVTTQAMTRGL